VDAGFVPGDTVSVEDVGARAVTFPREVPGAVVEPEATEPEAVERAAEPVAVEPETDGSPAEEPADPVAAFDAAWAAATARVGELSDTDGQTAPVDDRSAQLVATVESPLAGVSETPVFEPFARAELVQRVDVAVSDSYYPSHLVVQAHVPVEIGFGEGRGCLARVLFEEFGVDADLTDGGAIVRLPGLEEGTYSFSCGMKMVFGTLVAVS
jgi:Cupredoxin-like domain